jgi:hypothetical protein
MKTSSAYRQLTMVFCLLLAVCCKPSVTDKAPTKLRALIVDGQNNHGIWPKTTAMMKDYLEQTGMFEVDVARTAYTWQGPHSDNDVDLGKVVARVSCELIRFRALLQRQRPSPRPTQIFTRIFPAMML